MKKYIVYIVVGVLVCNGLVNHYRIKISAYDVSSNKLDNNYTIAQISDFHSNARQAEKIVSKTAKQNPDYILLTGDILEAESMDQTVEFIAQLTQIGQVIYARGNHDDQYQTLDIFKDKLAELGVIVLGAESYQTEDLNFIGIEDIDQARLNQHNQFADDYREIIASYDQAVDAEKYNILLGHRPNYLDGYSKLNVDLVLSGHAHGGQWQIPFTNIGVIAPDEGLFPTNVHGLKVSDNTTQIISSGTSNPYGLFIPRFFNPEEIVVVNLNKEQNE